jgi:hypothetical protein
MDFFNNYVCACRLWPIEMPQAPASQACVSSYSVQSSFFIYIIIFSFSTRSMLLFFIILILIFSYWISYFYFLGLWLTSWWNKLKAKYNYKRNYLQSARFYSYNYRSIQIADGFFNNCILIWVCWIRNVNHNPKKIKTWKSIIKYQNQNEKKHRSNWTKERKY